jgi:hypothetical protein
MSNPYRGKHYKRPQDRGSSSVQGGGGVPNHAARGGQDPCLNEISASHMERYIDSVHQFALSSKEHATVASWIRGRIPMVMLEHELPRTKERLLGLQAKHNSSLDASGLSVSLTAGEVRANLIKATVAENIRRRNLTKDTKANLGSSSMDAEVGPSGREETSEVGQAKDSKAKVGSSSMDADRSSRGSEVETDGSLTDTDDEELKAEALRDLFPHNAKKSREIERSQLEISASTLLSKMVYVWPSKDIRIKMLSTKSLVEAFENTDVIRFVEELKIFALSGTGNSETNREVAEAHLSNLKMKPGKALDYFKEFTEAVEHIRVCNSSFTEHKVVDLFFRHLNQISFPGWYIKFLTHDDVMYSFQKKSFEEAKDYALRYHDTVIRMSETVNNGSSGDHKKPEKYVKSFTQLKSALSGTGTSTTPIKVDPVVLSTLLQTVSKAKAADKKRRAEGDGKDETEAKKKIKAETNAAEKKICWKFRDEGTCEFGSKCHFAHIK